MTSYGKMVYGMNDVIFIMCAKQQQDYVADKSKRKGI